jgi:hypothetical protein
MKHITKAILAGSAFLSATSLSFGAPDRGGLPLSVASAQARVGHPATPASVAGVTRRHVRHGAYVAGATAVGTTAAVRSAYGAYGYGYNRSGCLPGPRVGAFATSPWDSTPTCPPY